MSIGRLTSIDRLSPPLDHSAAATSGSDASTTQQSPRSTRATRASGATRAAVLALGFGFGLAAALAVTERRALAHHSFAATFDGTKAIRLVGTLVKIEWTNPHSYFYLDVKEANGSLTRWALEAGAPGALSRRGFKRGDIKIGDTLIVDGYRAKDGSNLADARRVQLPDGRFVSGASAGDGGPEVNIPPQPATPPAPPR